MESNVTPINSAQQEAIDRAKAALARLPQEDATFQACVIGHETIHNVLEKLCEDGRGYKRKRSTRILESFKHHTDWMINISSAVDIAVQTSAGIACPVWAPLKFVLKVSHNHVLAAEQILNIVRILSDNLPRLELYAGLHEDSRFQVDLVNVFADILEFAADAHRFFSRRMPSRLGRLIGKNFEHEFGDVSTRIEQRTKSIDATAGALSQERAARFIKGKKALRTFPEYAFDSSSETQAKRQQDSRIDSMRWLQPSKIYECLQRNLASRIDGTCEWILRESAFLDWANRGSQSSGPRVLIIHGAAGCGKSVLGSFIHSTLQHEDRQEPAKPIVLYFSFSASHMDRRTLDSLVRTLLSQLLEHPHGDRLLPLLNGLMERGPPSTSDMFSSLNDAIGLFSEPIKAIIDGIDECSDSKDDIFKYVLEGLHTKSNLDSILLAQSHTVAKVAPSQQISIIRITSETNDTDMRTIIYQGIAQCTLLSASPLRDNVFTTLLAQADGMFLWTKMMLDYLGASLCIDEVSSRLSDLPHGLEESYALILSRLATRLDKHQQRLVSYLFSFATTCGRPLSHAEVQYAYALALKSESHAAQAGLDTFLLQLRPEDIIDICGGLLIFSDGVFRLMHNSARDFLIRPQEDWSPVQNPHLDQFRVDPTKSHRLLGNICLQYFLEVDLSQLQWDHLASLDLLNTRRPMLHYACLYIIYHLNRSNMLAEEICEKLLTLLESEHVFFAFEYVFMYGISKPSPQLQVDLCVLVERISQVKGISRESSVVHLVSCIKSRCDTERSKRVLKFGETDHRTTRWALCHEAILSTLSLLQPCEQSSLDVARSGETIVGNRNGPENTSHNPLRSSYNRLGLDPNISGKNVSNGSCRFQRFAQIAGTSESTVRVKELLQFSNVLPLGHQFELVLRMLHHVTLQRGIVDPLNALWKCLKKRATTMPLLQLAAVTRYYQSLGRNREAFEIGSIYLQRMDDRDTTLNIMVRLMMGFVSSSLDQHELAIAHFEYALPKMRFMKYWIFEGNEALAGIYQCCGRHGDAIRIAKALIEDSFTYRDVQRKEWIRVYWHLGLNLYHLHNHKDGLSALTTYINHYKRIFGEFTSFDSSYVRRAFTAIAGSRFMMDEYDEALEAIQTQQEITKNFCASEINDIDDIEVKRLRAIIITENKSTIQRSQESAKDALQNYIRSNCIAFGLQACRNACRTRFNCLVDEQRYDPKTAVTLFQEFLRIYEAVHESEKPLFEPHLWYDTATGYLMLASLHQNAGQLSEARELFQKSLTLCANGRGSEHQLSDDLKDICQYNESSTWLFLSVSETKLHNYLPAAKAACEAWKLLPRTVSGYEEDRERLSMSVLKQMRITCCQLWRRGPHAAYSSNNYPNNADLNAKGILVHPLRVRRTRSLSDMSYADNVPRRKPGSRELDALLLVQYQEYLDEGMRSGLRPRSCICHAGDLNEDGTKSRWDVSPLELRSLCIW